MHSHPMARLAFSLLDEKYIIFRKDLELPLIFCFFKGKQNKKESPKCDSLFGKDDM